MRGLTTACWLSGSEGARCGVGKGLGCEGCGEGRWIGVGRKMIEGIEELSGGS